MNKYTVYTTLFSVALAAVIGFAGSVSAQVVTGTSNSDVILTLPDTSGSNSDSSNSSITSGLPTTSGSNSDASGTTSGIPTTSGSNSDASGTTPGIPTTGGSNDSGVVSSSTASTTVIIPGIPTTIGSNGDEGSSSSSTSTTTSTTTTTTTPSGGGNAGAVSFFSGGGGGGGIGQAVSTSTSTPTNPALLSCPFLTNFVIPGQTNNPSDITKLQVFLSTYEHDSNVHLTGILDQATLNGIISFQQSYLSNIMGPWGSATPSGEVYITTLKEINNIVCSSSLNLSPSELAIINAYKAGLTPTTPNTNTSTTTNTAVGNSSTTTAVGSTTTESATTTTGNNSALTGSVVSSGLGSFFSGLFSKIWNFFSGK